MNTVVAAVIAAFASVGIAAVSWLGARIRRDLDACERDRRQLKQVLHLVVGSIVGLLPERDRLHLLHAVDRALDDDEAA